jgi:hypothetical protein
MKRTPSRFGAALPAVILFLAGVSPDVQAAAGEIYIDAYNVLARMANDRILAAQYPHGVFAYKSVANNDGVTQFDLQNLRFRVGTLMRDCYLVPPDMFQPQLRAAADAFPAARRID